MTYSVSIIEIVTSLAGNDSSYSRCFHFIFCHVITTARRRYLLQNERNYEEAIAGFELTVGFGAIDGFVEFSPFVPKDCIKI